MALALGLVAIATLMPISHGVGRERIPFWCLGCGDYALADIVANVALFVPLGWAMRRAGVRPFLSLVVVLATTIGVEGLQFGYVPGRVASLSDILTNTVGGVVGMAMPGLRRWLIEHPARAVRGATLYGVLVVAGLGVGVATQAVPLPRRLSWTEGSADTSLFVPFTGALRGVRVNGAAVTMHERLDVPTRGVVEIAVDLVSSRPDTGLAQIVVAWLPSGSAWMWLEQRDRDLHLHLTSASDRVRLRGHSVWLRHTMPATAGEPMTVQLIVRPFAYRIVVATNAGAVAREASVSPGDEWRLLIPFGRAWGSWTALLTAGWLAILAGPLGYLTSARSHAAVVVAAVCAGVSLLVLPIVSGCGWPSLLAWCGAASGFLVGSQMRTAAPAG